MRLLLLLVLITLVASFEYRGDLDDDFQ
jgi:hypothetical protein